MLTQKIYIIYTPTVQEKGTLICNVTQHYRYNTYSYETDTNYIMGWVGPSGLSLSQLFSLNAQYGFNRLLILGSGQIPVSSGPGSAWEPRSIFSTIGCARSWGILWVNTEDITKFTYMEIEIAIKKEHSQNPITSYHSFKQKIHDSSNSEINLIGCVINHSTLRFENPV